MAYVPIVDISGDPEVVGAELDRSAGPPGSSRSPATASPVTSASPAWDMVTRFFDLPLEDRLSVARHRITRTGTRRWRVSR